MVDHNTIAVFPTAVYEATLDAPTEDEWGFINSVEYRTNYGGNTLASVNDYILDSLPNLKTQVQEHLDNYVKQILNPIDDRLSLYITQSWLNINKKNKLHPPHIHTNSIISGVYYLSDSPAPIRFHKHFDFLETWQVSHKEPNIYNQTVINYLPKKHTLILFPSILRHSVAPNQTETERVSLAFNTFFRGPTGKREEMTYLELT